MGVPYRHIANQGPVITTMGRIAVAAIRQQLKGDEAKAQALPGPTFESVVKARPDQLVDDFIRWSGGDVRAWRGYVPPTLFPQWGFPLLGRTLTEINYPLAKVLNGGCRIEVHRPIPRGIDLHLKAHLAEIDDNGNRAILTQKLVTSSAEGEVLCVAHVQMIIPLKSGSAGGSKTRKSPILVPLSARPVADWRIPADAGLSFACLTGDFNPIHWLAPYAKLAGFGKRILHGFGSLAGSMERIRRVCWAGDPHMPGTIDVRFTRPLKVPTQVRVFMDGQDFYLGHAAGGRAYLKGSVGQLTLDN
jgi:hypothetical protein